MNLTDDQKKYRDIIAIMAASLASQYKGNEMGAIGAAQCIYECTTDRVAKNTWESEKQTSQEYVQMMTEIGKLNEKN